MDQPNKKNSTLTCSVCEKNFGYRRSLIAHYKKFHKDTDIPVLAMDQPTKKNSTLTCSVCEKNFGYRRSLVDHYKNFHKDTDIPAPTKKTGLKCHRCEYIATCIEDLGLHYKEVHEEPITIDEIHFPNLQEFFDWKADIEKKYACNFFKRLSPRSDTNMKTWLYVCSRSGEYKPVENRQRKLKAKGSSKIGFFCTSFIRVFLNSQLGSVKARYCLEHLGHLNNLCYLKLSLEMRQDVESQLREGVPTTKILDRITNQMEKVTQDTLITKKDITNIKHRTNTDGIEELGIEELTTDTPNSNTQKSLIGSECKKLYKIIGDHFPVDENPNLLSFYESLKHLVGILNQTKNRKRTS